MADNHARWRAHRHGGPITHVALDYGKTLTSELDVVDLMLNMRPVSPAAIATLWELDAAGVALALVSNTAPGHQRRRALQDARVDGLFGDRIYLSHELGLNKSPTFYRHVLDDLGIGPSALLVCGNNITNDILVPAELGIPAVLLAPTAARVDVPAQATQITQITELPGILTGGKPCTP